MSDGTAKRKAGSGCTHARTLTVVRLSLGDSEIVKVCEDCDAVFSLGPIPERAPPRAPICLGAGRAEMVTAAIPTLDGETPKGDA